MERYGQEQKKDGYHLPEALVELRELLPAPEPEVAAVVAEAEALAGLLEAATLRASESKIWDRLFWMEWRNVSNFKGLGRKPIGAPSRTTRPIHQFWSKRRFTCRNSLAAKLITFVGIGASRPFRRPSNSTLVRTLNATGAFFKETHQRSLIFQSYTQQFAFYKSSMFRNTSV